MYPKSPPTYVPKEEDDWGCEVGGVRRWLGWCEGETEQDLSKLDKESEEKEDPLTDDWAGAKNQVRKT